MPAAKTPTLSVLMTNYNHARYLREALDAVVTQSYRPLEMVIIDDASTDDSLQVMESYARKAPALRIIQNEKNLGVLENINRLVEMASGDYLAFPAADDKVLPGFFEKSMRLVAEHPQAGLCSGLSRFIDEAGNDEGLVPTPAVASRPCCFAPEEVGRLLCKHGTWTNNSTIFRRDAILAAGGFPKELGSYSDGFIQQVIALRHGACFIPEPLVCWRRQPAQYSVIEAGDAEKLLEIAERSERLMRTQYKDIFPNEYETAHANYWTYYIGKASVRALQASHAICLDRLRQALPPTSWWGRMAPALMQTVMRCERSVITASLYAGFQPITWAKIRGWLAR